MKVIGLTGGIGSGKSTVSDYLKSKNLIVLDADEISREMTKKGGEALPEILKAFGNKVFFENGELNRKALANIIFNDENKKRQLEKITTLVVVKKIQEIVENLRKNGEVELVFIDAPLLYEAKADKICDEVWVVASDFETRVKRVMLRDGFSREEVLARINNQLSDEIKIKRADVILDNSEETDKLYQQIDKLI